MNPAKSYRYMATDTNEWNPNNISKKEYQTEIGSTVNEVEEYLCRRVQDFVAQYGKPTEEPYFFTEKKPDMENTLERIMEVLKSNNWDKDAGI